MMKECKRFVPSSQLAYSTCYFGSRYSDDTIASLSQFSCRSMRPNLFVIVSIPRRFISLYTIGTAGSVNKQCMNLRRRGTTDMKIATNMIRNGFLYRSMSSSSLLGTLDLRCGLLHSERATSMARVRMTNV